MSDDLITLANMAVLNNNNALDLGTTDVFNGARLLSALAAQGSSNGTSHTYLKETGAPTVGFRSINAGRDHSKSTDEAVTITLKLLDATFKVDKAIADVYNKGAATFIGRELLRHLRAALFEAEKQILYGTGNSADGFAGLADNALFNALADSMVVNAGGSGNDCTSVWLFRSAMDFADVSVVAAYDGKIDVGESTTQLVNDGDGKSYPAYVTPVSAWLGMQIGGVKSVCRIANIDAGAPLTDDLIYEAISRFPAERQPTHIAMNMKAQEMLRKSRTATNATGAPAPLPVDVANVPIVTTSAITSTEAALT